MDKDREYRDFIGEMIEASGKKDEFKGNGKPLPKDYMKRDVFQNFQKTAKDAGFLPPWLKLQKEISLLVHAAETESDIEAINKKIRKHNGMCPAPMQKRLVTLNNLEKAKEIW
ncbi:hypothetical protein CFK37_18770 [Virgibacillus phasianinus]|uniref:DnaJ homologue subfamily C member 28 conserved domain-containing protein n=1 Tax=Virgibacillus phasianinus TaxID=2017483 RepID=A0A220U8J3_9BACI|nr:DnaJ family domain-containing protein [Virgibacillus phasianinus]ASK64053.1 hypothetical protein CFK37_18770 [Virgibacillus phasianinus]